jgi:hypothetical protein
VCNIKERNSSLEQEKFKKITKTKRTVPDSSIKIKKNEKSENKTDLFIYTCLLYADTYGQHCINKRTSKIKTRPFKTGKA